MNRPYRYTASPPLVRWASLALAAAPAFLSGTVTAQQEDVQAATSQPSVVFEPRVSVQHTITNNARLDATGDSDQVTEVIPGFQLISNTARVKGFVDYSLHDTYYARESRFNQIRHSLNANAVVEAIEQWAFFDVAAVVASQPISAFGPPVMVPLPIPMLRRRRAFDFLLTCEAALEPRWTMRRVTVCKIPAPRQTVDLMSLRKTGSCIWVAEKAGKSWVGP